MSNYLSAHKNQCIYALSQVLITALRLNNNTTVQNIIINEFTLTVKKTVQYCTSESTGIKFLKEVEKFESHPTILEPDKSSI
jgi:hypothetical protein